MRTLECIGLPGSGKSTLTGAILRSLPSSRFTLHSEASVMARAWRCYPEGRVAALMRRLPPSIWPFSLRDEGGGFAFHRWVRHHPEFFRAYLDWVSLHDIPSDDMPRLWGDMMASAARSEVISDVSHNAREAVIVEEGVGQRLLSACAFYPRLREPAWATMVDCFPVPAVLMVVTAPAALCVRRVAARSHPPRAWMSGMEPASLIEMWERGEQRLQELVSMISRRKGVRILSFSGESVPDDQQLAALGQILEEPNA